MPKENSAAQNAEQQPDETAQQRNERLVREAQAAGMSVEEYKATQRAAGRTVE